MRPTASPEVCVSLLASGRPGYLLAAREAVLSVLAHTDFAVRLARGAGPDLALPSTPRLAVVGLEETVAPAERARPFLRKLEVVRDCLGDTGTPLVLHLDADALVVAPLDAAVVTAALAGAGLALAEQRPLHGAGTDRAGYHAHFVRHSLAWIDPQATPPHREAFRYLNSGVVLGTRAGWGAFLDWALAVVARTGPGHQVGEHMIADQDYFQFWAHCANPGGVSALSWDWNHCEHWDRGFPRQDARIAHFSTFCLGPGRRELARMRILRLATRPRSRLAPLGRRVVRLLRRR